MKTFTMIVLAVLLVGCDTITGNQFLKTPTYAEALLELRNNPKEVCVNGVVYYMTIVGGAYTLTPAYVVHTNSDVYTDKVRTCP